MPLHQTQENLDAELATANEFAQAFNVSVHSFGEYNDVDYWIRRDQRLIGVLEVKTRTHNYGDFPTVFINVRKWATLQRYRAGLNTDAIYLIAFQDGTYYIKIQDIDASNHHIGGRSPRPDTHNDQEPIIHIPIEALTPLPAPPAAA